jgi:hypothetical protein
VSRLTTSPERQPITSGAAWAARDVADPADWSTHLSTVQQQDIIGAAKAFAGSGDQTHDALQAVFDLPSMRVDITDWVNALRAGRGFVLVRGFPTEELTPRETEVAYVGLGLQMGTPVSQNAAGDLLGHVRDEGVARRDPSVRLYQTRQRQDFHTDGADIVGLLCLHPARTGGESRIASSSTVYNRMLAERPDLIEVLYQPMFWDRNGEESVGEDPYFALPVISEVAGSPRIFFIGWYIRDAQRYPAVPRLTAPQTEAIELIERIANDESVHLEMDFRPGDIQWLANDRILHSREAYEDHPGPEQRRHLLRLWLAARTFASVNDLLREGIPVKDSLRSRTEGS